MTFDDYLALVLPHATRPESPDHGVEHWRRVAQNGGALAHSTPGADPEVVDAFAALHDSQRQSEYADPLHGDRAAALLARMDGLDHLTRAQRIVLTIALVGHDKGQTSDDPTIGCCWDADRLDLPRLGITPNPDLMSTDAGREQAAVVMASAEWWSRYGYRGEFL